MIYLAAVLWQGIPAQLPPHPRALRRCIEQYLASPPSEPSVEIRSCVDFEASKRHAGILVVGLETLRFIPGARSISEARQLAKKERLQTWLETDGRLPIGGVDRAYRLEFIGRQARRDGETGEGYGHGGGFGRMIFLDRALSVRDLGSIGNL